MSSWLKTSSSLLLAAALATGFAAGCTPGASPERQDRVHGLTHEDATELGNRQSGGVMVRNDLARKLNERPGFRNATVLMQDGNAYVGFTRIGNEKNKDAQIQSGDNWHDSPYTERDGSAKSARGMTVQELANEGLPNANTHMGPYSTSVGNISDADRREVHDLIIAAEPAVKNIFVTANIDDVQRLSGFRHFIARGGNMNTQLQEWNNLVGTKNFLNITQPNP